MATREVRRVKLLRLVDGVYLDHSFPARFSQTTADTVPRIHAGLPAGDLTPFRRLVAQLSDPYLLLYVLHTPRGEAEAGRYQSEPISSEQWDAWLDRFEDFLCADSRFDLWIHSPLEEATVVLDRHHQLFAYGPLGRYAQALRGLGYEEGGIEVPVPHVHQYLAEFDGDARALLDRLTWSRSELRSEDAQ